MMISYATFVVCITSFANQLRGMVMKMNKKLSLILLGGLIPLGFLLYPAVYATLTGCEPTYTPPEPTPIPDYNKDLFTFPKFNLPEAKAPDSVNLTVLNIIPEYKDTLNQEYAGGARVSAGGAMTKDMLKVFKSFAGSVGEDIEAQLVAKGMTTKSPFFTLRTSLPTASTMPMASWPMARPFSVGSKSW